MDSNNRYAPNRSPLRTSGSLNRSGGANDFSAQPHRQREFSNNREEEELYNRRRQEHLRAAANNSSASSQFLQPMLRPQSANQISEHQRSFPERTSLREQPPPTSHFTLGQQQTPQPVMVTSNNSQIPLHIREHISHLQSDNASLMRRLNLVHQELERINREKGELQSQLTHWMKMSTDIYDALNKDDNVDRVNKYMKDDLVYERDRNHKLKVQIQELNSQILNLADEIRQLERDHELQTRQNAESQYILQKHLGQIEDLEKEQYFNQERIKESHHLIEETRLSINELDSQKYAIRQAIEMLMAQRNELIDRVTEMSQRFDQTVREITAERQIIDTENSRHAKFITAKLMMNMLSSIYKEKLTQGFQEIVTYTNFDNKCNQKLKSLSKLLEKAGTTKLKIAINHWFSCTLKPVESKEQSYLLSKDVNSLQLRSKYYRLWREVFQSRIKSYDSKTLAIQSLWRRFTEEARVEKQRSFRIWKELFQKFKLQKSKVKRLLWRKLFKQLGMAISTWKNHDKHYNNQIRLGLLAQNFSHKQYLSIMYRHLHHQTKNVKRKRQQTLMHCLKGWKDYLAYQKYMMSQNLIATRFHTECFTSVIQGCFDAWKQHKQKKLYLKTFENLHSDELQKINNLTACTKKLKEERYQLNKQRACESVKVQLQKKLWSYIGHWRQINVDFHESLHSTVQDKLIKLFRVTMRVGFNRWKLLYSQNKKQERRDIISNLQNEQLNLQNDVVNMNNSNEFQQEVLNQKRMIHLKRCVHSYEVRSKDVAIARWIEQMQSMRTKESGAEVIMKRLRKRYLKNFMKIYHNIVTEQKKSENRQQRCQMYQTIRNERLKALTLNAWQIYKSNFSTAKDYWYRIFLKLDLTMKRLSVRKWRKVTQFKVEKQLHAHEDSIIQTIEDLNHHIGELHQQETDQQIEITERQSTLTTQGQRILANTFARFHSVNMTRGFEKWREFVDFERNKLRLLDKATQHIKKSQFYYVKASFKNWMQKCEIIERTDQLKREYMRLNDTIFQTSLQKDNFITNSENLIQSAHEEQNEQQFYNAKLQKTVQLIVKRVNSNHYTSQRRFIFQQWSDYVRREVYFINCIKKVLSKSLLQQGFNAINETSRDEQRGVVLSEVLHKFFQMFTTRTMTNSFSRWRSGSFTLVTQTRIATVTHTHDLLSKHHSWKNTLKSHNALKAEALVNTWLKKNSLVAWKNVSKWLKHVRETTLLHENELTAQRQRQALIRWRARKQATKERWTAFKRTQAKIKALQLKTYFKSLQERFFKQKELVNRLGNLAMMLDHQAYFQSFTAIKSYSKAKSFAYNKRIENGTVWMVEQLQAMVDRRTESYFTEFKKRCLNKRRCDTLKACVIGQNLGKMMRGYFLQWKNQSEKSSLLKELHEEGLVRQEEVGYRSELRNLKDLMKKEGYDDHDINHASVAQRGRQGQLLLKAVRRMQHYNNESSANSTGKIVTGAGNYLKPKMFDRWRMFVQARKLFRYYLQFVDKRAQYVKSDLHQAFDKWKSFHPLQHKRLTKQSKEELNKKAVTNSKALDKLSEELVEKENTIDHLNAQRDTLLDNYIKAQKLALALWSNRLKNSMHHTFLQWKEQAQRLRNYETSECLKRNLSTLESLKLRISQFEQDNNCLAGENEELRQFSLDGYEIAKNVQSLSAERELLSVDLADKAQVIKKLLDENEVLTRKLGKAQEHAQTLIRSTMKKRSNANTYGGVGGSTNATTLGGGGGHTGGMNRSIRS